MPREILPLHTLPMGRMPFAEAVRFAADGRLYVQALVRGINVWELPFQFWPEVVGTVLGISVLLLAIAVRRVMRRPQAVGAAHCRRCNYNLAGATSDAPCPECGAKAHARRAVVGRSWRRRLVVPASMTLMIGLSYGALFVCRFPREHRIGRAVEWWSEDLASLSERYNIGWLKRMSGPVRVLKEVDPATGVVVRTVHKGLPSSLGVSISPDGQTAITTRSNGELCAFQLPSGRVFRTQPRLDGVELPTSPFPDGGWLHAPGWLSATQVYVQAFDGNDKTHRLYLWDVTSGVLDLVCDIPSPVRAAQSPPAGGVSPLRSAPGPAQRKLYFVPGSVPPVAYEVPDRMQEGVEYGSKSTIRVLDLARNGAVVRELHEHFWGGIAPVFMLDKNSMLIRGWGGGDVLKISLSDGALQEESVKRFMGTLQFGPGGVAYHSGSGRVFISSTGPAVIEVREEESGEHLGDLQLGADVLPDDYTAISPDGRWVATFVSERKSSGFFGQQLLIFDLAALPPTRRSQGRNPEGGR